MGEVDDCVGVGMMALELAIVEDVVGAVAEVGAAEERGTWPRDVVVLDVLLLDVMGLAVVELGIARDVAFSPPSCELVHSTGFFPSSSTILKSLLTNVGGVAPKVLRSDTSKWHTQAFPSSRGTRADPVAETESLYAAR